MENIDKINIKLKDLKSCYRIIALGLIIICIAFTLDFLNNLSTNPIQFIKQMGMPTRFLGLGILLFGVGRHLHLLHLNVLKMNQEKMKM
ncbi:conserved protein of unknown function [Tenacibaculum sp. 190130A14a]|uniref:Uncharacterized protein n=1 Tax=Tenacibaculum polynesiense TaxID=3137857 RepID=A0ABM9PET6_9FLAO